MQKQCACEHGVKGNSNLFWKDNENLLMTSWTKRNECHTNTNLRKETACNELSFLRLQDPWKQQLKCKMNQHVATLKCWTKLPNFNWQNPCSKHQQTRTETDFSLPFENWLKHVKDIIYSLKLWKFSTSFCKQSIFLKAQTNLTSFKRISAKNFY